MLKYVEYLLRHVKLSEMLVREVGDSLYYFDKQNNPNKHTTKGFLGYAIKITDTLERFFKCDVGNSLATEFRTYDWLEFIERTLDQHKEKGC